MSGTPSVCLVKSFWALLNSNFSTAFFGAVAGSVTILAVEWYRGQRRVLSDVNASIGVLSGLLNTFLNIKRQHSLPVLAMYKQDCETYQAMVAIEHRGLRPAKPGEIRFNLYLKKFYCPKLHFDVPLERIFALTDRNPAVVPILLQAKRSVEEVQSACLIWNDLTTQAIDLPEEKRIEFYFGKRSADGITNTFYADTVQNLASTVDDALFFTNRAIQEVAKTAKGHLHFGLNKKVVRMEIIDEEHRALMPSETHKAGW